MSYITPSSGFLITENLAPIAVETINVNKNQSMVDAIYNQVILTPMTLDLGSLTGTRVDYIELWNANVDNVVLTNITPVNVDGLVLNGRDTGVIYSNSIIEYELTSSAEGSSTIDAQFVFNFTETENNTSLSVTGSRVALFNYPINWSSSNYPNIYLRHLTDVLESYNGQEERYGLSENARMSIEYYYSVTGSDRRKIENFIYNNSDSVMQVPAFHSAGLLLQDYIAGQSSIFIDLNNNIIQDGVSLYVGEFDNYEILKVDTVDRLTNEVFLENLTTKSFYVGDPTYPLMLCYMNPSISTSSPFKDFTNMSLKFDLQDNTIDTIVDVDDNFEEYNGLKVFIHKPSTDVTVNRIIERKIDIIDNNFGIRSRFTQDKSPSIVMNYTFSLVGNDNITENIAFFENMKGRLHEFYITSGLHDLNLSDDIQAFETAIDVDLEDQSGFNGKSQKSLIRIELFNGDTYIKEILSYESIEGSMRLFIDSNFGVDISKESVANIQYLYNARLNTDEIQIQNLSYNYAVINADIKILRNV